MATGENVLWVLERTHKKTKKVVRRLVFRTRDAAITDKVARQNVENAVNSGFYWYRRRATWGPES